MECCMSRFVRMWRTRDAAHEPPRQPVVTILGQSGRAVEFPRRVKCSELLLAYPSHTVLLASAVVLRRPGRRLPRDAFLEVGHTYLLATKPSAQSPVQFVISKEHAARIMREAEAAATAAASVAPAAGHFPSPLPVRQPRKASYLKGERLQPWVFRLSPIPEIAAV